MDILIFLGAFLILVYPSFLQGRTSFIDNFLFLCLYLDAVLIFTNDKILFTYYISFLIMLYTTWYFLTQTPLRLKYFNSIFYLTIIYLIIYTTFPVVTGSNFRHTVAYFAITFPSLIIPFFAFHYYATHGNIFKLFKNGYTFIFLWCIIVIGFSIFKVSGLRMSEGFGGGYIFYGDMGIRGVMTYISFSLLLVPFLFKYLKGYKRTILLICTAFILFTILIALKRFSFVVIGLGLANYWISSKISLKTKIALIVGLAIIAGGLLFSRKIDEMVEQRYEQRGGEHKFGTDNWTYDLRIFEPFYVLEDAADKPFIFMLIGTDPEFTMDISTDLHDVEQRDVHNEYAMLFMYCGLIGVSLYILILVLIYLKTRRLYKQLKKKHIDVSDYWIVFQNFMIIFMIEGMAGGHSHLTFRGMVLLYSGAIAGYFYKLTKENQRKHVPESTKIPV